MKFRTEQWIAWLGATVVAAFTMAAFAYSNFETRDHARESKDDVVKRLDRIEEKLDELLAR